MKPKLYIVTESGFKFKELSHSLNDFFDCEQKSLDEPEIQGTAEEIIKHKMLKAYEFYKHPVLVDDTSVHFDALNGFPGPYVKDFRKCISPYEIGIKFLGSKVTFIGYLGLCRGEKDFIIAQGVVDGVVVKPREIYKDESANLDIFFQVEGHNKPMIELEVEEKNKFSHRGLALKKLLEILKSETK